jgi:hypothetical protein
MWIIQQEQNRHTFENIKRSKDQLLESLYGLLFDWSKAWGYTSATSLADFVASLCSAHFTTSFPL